MRGRCVYGLSSEPPHLEFLDQEHPRGSSALGVGGPDETAKRSLNDS